MAQNQFNVTINQETLCKLINNMLVDSLPNKKAMTDFLARIVSKGFNGNDFFMALTDTFPKVRYRIGDSVRVKTKSLYYSIDNAASEEKGYIKGDGIYVNILHVDPYSAMCYVGDVSFVDTSGHITTREFEFNNDNILMDNTARISVPDLLPGDLI